MTPRRDAELSCEDVAIVGMACLFPGADDPSRFWQNIVDRVDCVTDPPPDWQAEWFLDPSGTNPDRTYTGKGGYLGDLCRFDPLKYGVMPSSVEGAEPDQFVALRCAFEALEDAGFPETPLNRERAACILGRGTYVNRGYISLLQHTYGIDQILSVLRQLEPERDERELAALRAELKRSLPPFNAETVPGLAHSVMVGRIANRLDLKGPAYTIDAACSSSLIAVENAMRELRSGSCDVALAGGVQVSTPAIIDILFCHLGALSRSGMIAPFSAEANGTLLGQGCGIVVLKRRSDAERDGNRIYALLKSVGISSDGKGGGLLAPLTEGQQLAVRRAYELSALSPTSIGLVEAHGTGIPLGDAVEMETLRKCFGDCPEDSGIAVGSVKSMISHLIPAAGIASLIKTALALYQRVIPPTLHAEAASAELGLESTPFHLATSTRPWIHGDRETPRRAGVNAFGFGGINAHAILEEHRPDDECALASLEREWPVELVVISAGDRDRLGERLRKLSSWISKAKGLPLVDVAASAARERGACRIAICAASVEQLAGKLARAAEMLAEKSREKIQQRGGMFWYAEPLAARGGVAFVFPGEGAQYSGMLAELCRHFPEARREFDLADEASRLLEGSRPLSREIFPNSEQTEPENGLFDTGTAVEAATTADRALLAIMSRLGIRPDAVVGHSSGEFAALLAAGAIEIPDDEELVRGIAAGASCTHEIVESGVVGSTVLTAVGGAGVAAVEEVVAESEGALVIALDNCPHQAVIAGDEEATRRATQKLGKMGALCERLPWGRPYHTAAFRPACEYLDDYYRSLRIREPRVPVWSCAAVDRYPSDPQKIRELAIRQWHSTVYFRQTIERMYEAGLRVFVEVGPRGNLSAFINDILGKRSHVAVALDLPRKGGIEQLCRALGMLSAHGVDVDLEALYSRRRPQLLDLAADPPAAKKRAPLLRLDLPGVVADEAFAEAWRGEGVSRRGDGDATAEAPEPLASEGDGGREERIAVRKSQRRELPPDRGGASAGSQDSRARALADYQLTMRAFLDVQRGVMTGAARNTRSLERSQTKAPAVAEAAGKSNAGMHSRSEDSEPPSEVPLAAHLPFVESVVLFEPRKRLIVECELDAEKHPFLRDHRFGRLVSLADPSLAALPVMPVAMTLELMAEAAAALRPDEHVCCLRALRVFRWLAFPASTRLVRVEAIADGDAISAAVYQADGGAGQAKIAEVRVELSRAAATLGAPTIEVDPRGRSNWRADELYTRGLFHGPAFRSVRSIDATDGAGVRATLEEPDPALLSDGIGDWQPLLPVGLIDAAGQMIGFWGAEDDFTMGFPIGFERLELPAVRKSGERLVASGRIRRPDRSTWSSDVEVCTGQGAVVLRVLGRRDRVMDVPSAFWRYRIAPKSVVFSRDATEVFAGVPGVEACTICVLDDFRASCLLEDSGFWALVLSRLALNRRERDQYDRAMRPPRASASWLLSRVVAKDAVRLRTSLELCMADVEIRSDDNGRPWPVSHLEHAPRLSIAHKDLDAVAVAADSQVCKGVGIDLEPSRPLDAYVANDAFRVSEREIIERATRDLEETPEFWLTHAWCAKEAMGKALGSGVKGGPRNIRMVEFDPGEGRFAARLEGSMRELLPGGMTKRGSYDLDAFVRVFEGRVIALSILESRE